MHEDSLDRWQHSHAFGTEAPPAGERRTHWVIALTAVMMVVEISAGLAFGSMALLADGWHMATHVAAFGMAAFAYRYARRRAHDHRFSFGTGKVTALGGFAGAVSLGVAALFLLVESIVRLASPVAIRFGEAIGVAVLGLVVNFVSAMLLDHPDGAEGSHGHHDHNLRAAYLHVLADVVTSLLAIAALSAGKFLGWTWLDSLSGILGAAVITQWALRLLRDTAFVLLDAEVPEERHVQVRTALESEAGDRVADLHLWRVGPRHLGAIVSIVTRNPRDPSYYKEQLRRFEDLAHVTVEVHRCAETARAGDANGQVPLPLSA